MARREAAVPVRAALAVLASSLLLTLALAGCTSPQAVPVRVREGDFLVLDLAAWGADGREVLNLTQLHAVVSSEAPARTPEGWDVNATTTLPPGLVDALLGAFPGTLVETPLLPPAEAFGAWSEGRAIRAPRVERVPREVSGAALEACDGCPAGHVRVRWAGSQWEAEAVGGDPPRVRLLVDPGHVGRVLELPDYWSERYELWRSRLADVTEDGLVVEHLADEGRTVLVGGLAYRVRSRGEQVLADGNHELAGQELRFRAFLRQVAFPGSPKFPVAPDALLVTTEGRVFNLSDLRGQAVLLDFYATWCVTCKQQAPALARAHEEFGGRVAIISVSIDPTDTPDRVEAFRAEARRASQLAWGRELPVDWTFASDPTGRSLKAFSVTGIPREVVLDADHRIRSTSVGLHPWPDLKRGLQEALEPP